MYLENCSLVASKMRQVIFEPNRLEIKKQEMQANV